MSTLELSELLNQEMVENPCSRISDRRSPQSRPTWKPEEKPAQEKTDSWDDQDRVFFGDYLDDATAPAHPPR